jgi:hypothetical protein
MVTFFCYPAFGGRFIGHSDDVWCLFNISWICNHQGAMAILLVYSIFIGDLLPICVCSSLVYNMKFLFMQVVLFIL